MAPQTLTVKQMIMSAIRANSRCFFLDEPSKINHLQAVTGKHLHPFLIHFAQKYLQTGANRSQKIFFSCKGSNSRQTNNTSAKSGNAIPG